MLLSFTKKMCCESSVSKTSAGIKSYVEGLYHYFFQWLQNHSLFFVVAVLVCALYTKHLECHTALFGGEGGEVIMRFNCLQIPESMWHNRNYHVKFQLHLCTLSYTFALYMCVCIYFACSMLSLAYTRKGDPTWVVQGQLYSTLSLLLAWIVEG